MSGLFWTLPEPIGIEPAPDPAGRRERDVGQ